MLIIYITSFCCHELHKAIIGLERDVLEYCENIWLYISYKSEFTRQIQSSNLTPGWRIFIGEWCIKCRRETLSTWPQCSYETVPHAIHRNLLTWNRNRKKRTCSSLRHPAHPHPPAHSAQLSHAPFHVQRTAIWGNISLRISSLE